MIASSDLRVSGATLLQRIWGCCRDWRRLTQFVSRKTQLLACFGGIEQHAEIATRRVVRSVVHQRSGESPYASEASNEGVLRAAGQTRTDDLRFTKASLYQLSYGGGHCCDRRLAISIGNERRMIAKTEAATRLKGQSATDSSRIIPHWLEDRRILGGPVQTYWMPSCCVDSLGMLGIHACLLLFRHLI